MVQSFDCIIVQFYYFGEHKMFCCLFGAVRGMNFLSWQLINVDVSMSTLDLIFFITPAC